MSSSPTICPCDTFVHPRVITNLPGQSSIAYRVGDYITFRHALLLSRTGEVELANWRPSAKGDLALQMMEWWAYVADILTFYNERIANQDYLRTADLPESVQRLIRILGYRPRPGIGATGTLGALMTGVAPFTVAQGFQVQSKPGPGQQAQIFELSSDTLIQAPAAVSADPLPNPALLGPDGASVLLQGVVSSVKKDDDLLLMERGWGGTDSNYAFVTVQTVSQESDPRGNKNTRVTFTQAPSLSQGALASDYRLLKSSQTAHFWQYPASPSQVLAGGGAGVADLDSLARGIKVGDVVEFEIAGGNAQPQLASVTRYSEKIWYANPKGYPTTTNPDPSVAPDQPAVAIPIPHTEIGFQPGLPNTSWCWGVNGPSLAQILNQNQAQPTGITAYLDQDQSLKFAATMMPDSGAAWWWYWGIDGPTLAQLLTANAARLTSLDAYIDTDKKLKFVAVMVKASGSGWWWYWGLDTATLNQTLTANNARLVSLDAYIDTDGTLKYAVIMVPEGAQTWWWYAGIDGNKLNEILQANSAQLISLSAYVDTDKNVKFAAVMVPSSGQAWWWYGGTDGVSLSQSLAQNNAQLNGLQAYLGTDGTVKLAAILGPAASQPVIDWYGNLSSLLVNYAFQDVGELVGTPATVFDGSQPSLLAVQPPTFPPGFDVPLLLSDANGNGESAQGSAGGDLSTLQLAGLASPAVSLMPPINVLFDLLAVSRGKTVANEILGSGDATIAIGQEFVLKNSPLTYLQSADSTSGSGYQSTLRVWVNGIRWKEVPSFYQQPANASVFVTREDEQNQTHVQFGDGINGARLPSGVNNVVATYRYGSGADSPASGTLTVILKQQPRLKAILNPLAVGGGADPDPPQQIKRYAPQSVLTFGRAVSGDDYETIAAQAPGVARAKAYWTWDVAQQRTVVKIYVGDDANAVGDAHTALAAADDPNRPVVVVLATAVPISLGFTVLVDPAYIPADVMNGVTTALVDPQSGLLGTDVIAIGQSIYLSQIYRACLRVPGAVAVHSLSFERKQLQSYLLFPFRPLHFISKFFPLQIGFPLLHLLEEYRFDPGEGGFFQLSASDLNVSTEVAGNGG
ncbi:MAG TPA: hypothetical protein VKM93_03275 [Terriglobia bacterium]|nr:hypothetical protein [Terriglobia bacterium]